AGGRRRPGCRDCAWAQAAPAAGIDRRHPGGSRNRGARVSRVGIRVWLTKQRARAVLRLRAAISGGPREPPEDRAGMTVSIVIATFNRAALLTECLEHLARQPFAAGDEVIVVDNASTD